MLALPCYNELILHCSQINIKLQTLNRCVQNAIAIRPSLTQTDRDVASRTQLSKTLIRSLCARSSTRRDSCRFFAVSCLATPSRKVRLCR